MFTIECRAFINIWRRSHLFVTCVFMVLALWFSPNHMSIKYRCPIKETCHLRPIYLSELNLIYVECYMSHNAVALVLTTLGFGIFSSCYWGNLHFLIPLGYGYLNALIYLFILTPFKSIYHARIFIPKYNHPSINIVLNDTDPKNNSSLQRFSHFDIPTKYQNRTSFLILTPTCKSLIPLLMLIIDTMHSPLFKTNTG